MSKQNRLEELRALFAQLLEEYGDESPTVDAIYRWHRRDQEARQVLAETRLLKAVFGTANPTRHPRGERV